MYNVHNWIINSASLIRLIFICGCEDIWRPVFLLLCETRKNKSRECRLLPQFKWRTSSQYAILLVMSSQECAQCSQSASFYFFILVCGISIIHLTGKGLARSNRKTQILLLKRCILRSLNFLFIQFTPNAYRLKSLSSDAFIYCVFTSAYSLVEICRKQ